MFGVSGQTMLAVPEDQAAPEGHDAFASAFASAEKGERDAKGDGSPWRRSRAVHPTPEPP